MKSLRRLLLIAVWFHLPICIAEEPAFDFTAGASRPLQPPQLMLLTYKTRLLPKWSFDVEYDRALPSRYLWVDTVDQYSPIDSLRLSASRTLGGSSQRLFASVQTSYEHKFEDSVLYLHSNAGMAASFGWQLGDPRSLNMAVEYEYREVGDFDINSLVMGVEYAF